MARVVHLAMKVDDIDKASAFLCNVFGFKQSLSQGRGARFVMSPMEPFMWPSIGYPARNRSRMKRMARRASIISVWRWRISLSTPPNLVAMAAKP